MKKLSEGNKGIQALAKENPALVEDKFGYDVPGYFMGGMPGVDEAVDEAQKDLEKQNKLEKLAEILSMIGESSDFTPLVKPRKIAGIEAIIPKIRRPEMMPQNFRRGGMTGGIGMYERDFIFDDFDINDYIENILGGDTTPELTEEQIAEQEAQQAAMRLAKGYGASGATGGSRYSGTTPGADITINARSENPAVYKFYPSEVSKLYSQIKGVPFSPLVAPPKEATFIDDLQPRRITSQLYAKDGKFVDRSELITGPGGERGDKIPAMLSDGEFVVNAAAVRGIGLQAGANPEDEYEQRLLGARKMYEMQKIGEDFANKLT
tara:strand:- start:176 stop:1138 length:963 start_codon:yes stop_codon:yes gene_type:complete